MDKYTTCALPEMSNLVKRMQTHCHTTSRRKKEGVAYKLNAPWAPSDETRIVHSEETVIEAILNQSKKRVDKVLSYIITISDLSGVTLSEILKECGVTAMTMH